MSVVNIIIGAVNKTKAVFEEVGNQVVDLNKRANKLGSIFKGLFVAGFAAQFIKGILSATTETEKLEKTTSRLKESFKPITQTIADGLVQIITSLEGPIQKVTEFLNTIVRGVQFVSAYVGALIETKSHDASMAIAEQTITQLDAERQAREEAQKTAAEREELAKEEQAQAKRIAEEKAKELDELANLERKNQEKAQGLIEDQMSKRELLDKKLHDLKMANIEAEFAALQKNERARLEAEGRSLELQKEIYDIKKDIQTEDSKAAKVAMEEPVKKAAQQEISDIEKQREQFLSKQSELRSQAEEKRRLAIDEQAMRDYEQQQKEREKEESRFSDLLKSAKSIMERPGADVERLSAAERMAYESDLAAMGAEQAGIQAEESQKKIEELQTKMQEHLQSIDEKISNAITFTR